MAPIGTAGSEPTTSEIRTPQDAILILCQLQAEVSQNVYQYKHTADCFCGLRDDWVEKGAWKNEGKAIDFIINATRDAMEEVLLQRKLDKLIDSVIEDLG